MPSSSSTFDTTIATRPTSRRRSPGRDESGAAGEDGWVDVVADEVGHLLEEERLDLELVVFYDPLTETLHAVGYDGSPARYFRTLESESKDAERGRRGTPDPSSPEKGDALPLTASAGMK